ncbi:hypothetical protein TsFJ059_006402 [Trichoderma semiorbis]|uniref:Uncharacterized protein n=1 Tax=Trichoderma semiorbis TaxID=1491008 RepID=A0A9P8KKJ4_9HYPO|nr:hypothetical protein TsFJ059_006402 [Trichoderma semiorbis]
MLDHPLAEHMRQCNAPSWGHFVILRVMFGASQCARQKWWAEFKGRYEKRAGEDAPPGVVPRDVDEVLRTNRMRAPAVVKIPTMEIDGVYGKGDCGCEWCLKKKADKASRGSTSSSSQEARTVRREQGEKEKCPRGESIFTGEGETREDRARRFEREQGVEPEEAQDDDDDDDGESEVDEVTGVVTQASSLQERSTLVCTDGADRSLREVVIEQGSMIETLVRLVERQHERMGRLERRVNGV